MKTLGAQWFRKLHQHMSTCPETIIFKAAGISDALAELAKYI